MNYLNSLIIVLKLIDDLLDFTSHESVMGKPTAADLKLGLATAPVLYAAQVRLAIVLNATQVRLATTPVQYASQVRLAQL